MASEPLLSLRHLDLGYDAQAVLSGVSLDITAGEFVSLLGPSGCGKSTILRAIAGFLPPFAGQIFLQGRNITRESPERRDVGIVFQNYALFPTMTAFENIAFGLRVAKRPAPEIRTQVEQIAETAGISDYLDRKPANLSGGQQQRVAIARALIMGARVLLFDEPLSNLDTKVRLVMRREIKRLQREIGFTALFVTHDQEEALSMSDRIAVLNNGRIEQIGTAQNLYRKPATPFVASFVGTANDLSAPAFAPLTNADQTKNKAQRCFVKYEDVLINDHGIPAKVTHVEFLGPTTRVDLDFQGHTLSALTFDNHVFTQGDIVPICLRPGSIHFFDGEQA